MQMFHQWIFCTAVLSSSTDGFCHGLKCLTPQMHIGWISLQKVSVCLILQTQPTKRATFVFKLQNRPINETFLVFVFNHCVKCWKTKGYRSDNHVCTTKLLFLLDLRLQQSRYIITDHETIYCRFPALALLPMVAAVSMPSAQSWTSRCEIQIDLE